MLLFLPVLPAIVAPVVQSSFDDAYLAIASGGVQNEAQALRALGTVAADTKVMMRTNGSRVIWYVRASPTDSVALRFAHPNLKPNNPVVIGQSGWIAFAEQFNSGTGFRWSVTNDDRQVGSGDYEYHFLPDKCKPQPGVPKGELVQLPKISSTVYPGTDRDIWVYVPNGYSKSKPACLMVFQDGQWAKNYMQPVFDNMIASKEIPQIIGVFITPGTYTDGRSNRSVEYDTLSSKYSEFLMKDVLPVVSTQWPYREGAENRAIAGLSSGAICAFTVAWERPDQFHKVLSWIGSYVNLQGGSTGIGGGHNYPTLIRKSKGNAKNIRVFLQEGTNDLDNPFGNWPLANMQMEKAFSYSGYDYKFTMGQGFHSDSHGRSILPESLRWLWRGVKID
jgi:enterochelin esterase family protein